jgi:hypothetical protein
MERMVDAEIHASARRLYSKISTLFLIMDLYIYTAIHGT